MLAACLLAGCAGEGDDGESVEDLLDDAFAQEIGSADLKLEAEIDLDGVLEDPVRLEAEGPFRSNDNGLPQADIELRIGSDGGGQTITSGVLLTGDRAFVKFQDVYYEQPRDQVRRANRAVRRNARRDDRPLSEFGLDPRSWLAEANDEGEAEVAGVQTRHVSGTLDVADLMRNLNQFARRSGSALGGGGRSAAPLGRADIQELSQAVKDPSFDVYVGEDDDIIRRVSGRVEFDVPEAEREGLGGLEGGSIVFSVEFSDVNGEQQIEAPANARPISDLTETLGTGALGALGAPRDGGDAPIVPADPDPPSSSAGEDSQGSPEAEAFREYADCLDKARPEDTEELQRCADLLQTP
jgi:hypothetical protein